jgi:hypothetical protein
LAPNDFHLFPTLEGIFGWHILQKAMKNAVKRWLNGLLVEVYDVGIQKLVTRYEKCLNVGGYYVE